MEEETPAKWEGEVAGEVKDATADEIWALFADFCNLHKWFPIDTCYQVDGVSGQPGLIRYCATAAGDSAGAPATKWVKERLLLIDPIRRVLSYEVLENNIGFKSYVATIKVLPIDGGDNGCKIVWSFVSDPIQGWRFKDLVEYLHFCLQNMAEKTGKVIQKISG